jgi:hypothetical protein
MKKIILLALFAGSLSLTSCIKLTKCECYTGKTLKVNGNDASEIRANCESQSGGDCTY